MDWISQIVVWWVGLFGVGDPAGIQMAIVIVASGMFLGIGYVAVFLAIAIIGGTLSGIAGLLK